jgi:hypothetical protein
MGKIPKKKIACFQYIMENPLGEWAACLAAIGILGRMPTRVAHPEKIENDCASSR